MFQLEERKRVRGDQTPRPWHVLGRAEGAQSVTDGQSISTGEDLAEGKKPSAQF